MQTLHKCAPVPKTRIPPHRATPRHATPHLWSVVVEYLLACWDVRPHHELNGVVREAPRDGCVQLVVELVQAREQTASELGNMATTTTTTTTTITTTTTMQAVRLIPTDGRVWVRVRKRCWEWGCGWGRVGEAWRKRPGREGAVGPQKGLPASAAHMHKRSNSMGTQ